MCIIWSMRGCRFWNKRQGGKILSPNDVGLSRKHVIEGVLGSLQRMQLDYADIVFARAFHFVIPLAARTPIERTPLRVRVDAWMRFVWSDVFACVVTPLQHELSNTALTSMFGYQPGATSLSPTCVTQIHACPCVPTRPS
jgi:hypothetical protein